MYVYIYILSFLVIYHSNTTFISASQILNFFKKHFLTAFTKHSVFSKSPVSYRTF